MSEDHYISAWVARRRAYDQKRAAQRDAADAFHKETDKFKRLSTFSDMTLDGYGEGGFRGLRWRIIEDADILASKDYGSRIKLSLVCYTNKTNYHDHPVHLAFEITPELAERLALLFSSIAKGDVDEEGISA